MGPYIMIDQCQSSITDELNNTAPSFLPSSIPITTSEPIQMSSPDCYIWAQLATGGYVGDLPPQKEMSVAKAMTIFDQKPVCTPKPVSVRLMYSSGTICSLAAVLMKQAVPASSQSATAPSTSTIKSPPACDGFPHPVVESAIWLTLQPAKVNSTYPHGNLGCR